MEFGPVGHVAGVAGSQRLFLVLQTPERQWSLDLQVGIELKIMVPIL